MLQLHPTGACRLTMSISPDEREQLRKKFVEYQRTGERRLRNELIEAHKSLASHLARRFANRGEPFDDLLQVAYLGMLKAVERFDTDRNLEFSTFATATVEGELKRHFRDRTWSVRVPRRPQELHLRLGNVINELSQKLQRPPRVPEVAAELGVREEDVLEAMEVGGAYRSTSLDSRPSDSGETLTLESRLGSHDEGFDLAEHRVLLERLLEELPERERMIIELRFYNDMTQTEIAQQVGISQMHVSRLLARTLIQLRERLQTLDA
jgi:RNA polymerase sigma-B factor